MQTLQELFEEELKDIYNAEHQLIKALPKMADKAASSRLKSAFTKHLDETKNQVKRLDTIGEELGIKLTGKRCAAMEGLVEEGKEVLDEEEESAVVDAALIAAAQRVEHYEIAAYGNARALAEELQQPRLAQLLQETLDEESAADKTLTEICENEIFAAAGAVDSGVAQDEVEDR